MTVEEVGPLSPQAFIEYWHGQTVRELARAEQPGATAQERGSLPFIRERIRMYEWLSAGPITSEQELVDALERVIRGKGPTLGVVIYGAISQAARELLAEWRHPDRDARQPYT